MLLCGYEFCIFFFFFLTGLNKVQHTDTQNTRILFVHYDFLYWFFNTYNFFPNPAPHRPTVIIYRKWKRERNKETTAKRMKEKSKTAIEQTKAATNTPWFRVLVLLVSSTRASNSVVQCFHLMFSSCNKDITSWSQIICRCSSVNYS